MFEGSSLEDQFFAFFTRKYVQRADDRQKLMGLTYTEAETHDLAKETARFVYNARVEITDAAIKRAAMAIAGDMPLGQLHRASEVARKVLEAALNP